ncbi:MAG: ribulose-phosphate 3-epimerase [Chthonomonas sp.]|nr:ribulose-phosphate 3-epimerase [Chthonomonas sp.]
MKTLLAPSILSFDPAEFRPRIEEVCGLGADLIHLDVMDGQFVPPITFGADLAKRAVEIASCPVEAHLMTMTPERHFEAFANAGCFRIIFHVEAVIHSHRLCSELRAMGIEAGVAINPSTDVEALRPLLDVMDMALVMTVNPGWGGQALIPSCLEKVQRLRSWRPDLPIQVDGGIDDTTAATAKAAGANVFVVGSYLTRGPMESAVQALRSAWP